MPPRLHLVDLALIVVYLLGITLFGLRFRKSNKDQSLRNYFLADNTVPWWAIALSIVSAETSTLTIISVPGVAFTGDFGFLQIVLGYMLGRIVVALLFLPLYFEGRMLTAYQLIDRRFGPTLHKVTAGLFLLTRAAAEGVRVFAVSIVVGIAIGTRDTLSIGIISLLTLLYTFEGGMAAVIWTDVVQMVIYLGGTLVAIVTLGARVPGGWAHIHAAAGAAGKFHLFHFAFNLTQTYTFWAGLIGGTFLTMASHGTDQLMVQRMLAARSPRDSRLALLSSGVVIFVQFTLFLLIGAGLWVFYGAGVATAPDRLFPTFIVAEMPVGIAGLLVAAIMAAAMSNLSAALNSLSSTTVVDFLAPMRFERWRKDERAEDAKTSALLLKDRDSVAYTRITNTSLAAKLSTVFWAIVLFAVAVYSVHAGGKGHVVEIGLSIASVAYGALLGVFLLGTLTRYATQTGAILGMIAGFATNLVLWLFPGRVLWTADIVPSHVDSPGTITVDFDAATKIVVPHIAFTWYVFLGALVTFAIGSLASLLFRKQSRHKAIAVALAVLFVIPVGNLRSESLPGPQAYDFSSIQTLLTQAIADKKLPGAVVLIGHNNQVVFHQAFGVRKLAGEPGLDGTPSPAEPMTEDTTFDMASLSKCLSTAAAVMQLYEAGKLAFDDPVAKYLPAFAANGKSAVTIRQLLTHYSGLPPDVDLKDPWGLAAPDKAEGLRRALASPLTGIPGTHFEYSDINYIVLGVLVEKLSGLTLDDYAREHIFRPMVMIYTGYPSSGVACGGPSGAGFDSASTGPCPFGNIWYDRDWTSRTAPTAHDDESKSNPSLNPNFDHLLRGTVHDPTTRRMGGVAGHAGVFSTANDIGLFAQALLDKLTRNTGPFPLSQATLRLMTTPEQPPTAESTATIFTPDGQPTKGVALRGFGWDINSAFSRPRGSIFPIGSFGHTGFTGTSLWMDPASNTYVILLANAIHPRGGANISALRGQLATTAAQVLGLSPAWFRSHNSAGQCMCTHCEGCPGISIIDNHIPPKTIDTGPSTALISGSTSAPPGAPSSRGFIAQGGVLTGIDVLASTHYAALADAATRHHSHLNHLNLGLLTNQTGLDAQGHRTIDLLLHALPQVQLTTLFSPEHGLSGMQDTEHLRAETDAATQLPIISLYGAKESDRRPKSADLAKLDAVVIDLQDAGTRFYTYETVLEYFLEAAAGTPTEIIVLDRPALTGGAQVQGPISDPSKPGAYINYIPLPVRHGLTLGELARYVVAEKHLDTRLTVVPLQNWTRAEYFDQTGLPWINPSPNLRSLTAAILYPGTALVETTNVSVGRGSDHPFEQIGAPYIDAQELAAYLEARHIPGVAIAPTTNPVPEDTNRYPYHGQTIPGIRFTVTDRTLLDAPELGIELLAALHHLYLIQFNLAKANTIIANAAMIQALEANTDPRTIAATWAAPLAAFKTRRQSYLLYP